MVHPLVLLGYAASRRKRSNDSIARQEEAARAESKKENRVRYFGWDKNNNWMGGVEVGMPEYQNFGKIVSYQVGNNQPQNVPEPDFKPQEVYWNKYNKSFMTAQQLYMNPPKDIGGRPVALDLGNYQVAGHTTPEGTFDLYDTKILEGMGIFADGKAPPTYRLGSNRYDDVGKGEAAWLENKGKYTLFQVDSDGNVTSLIAAKPQEDPVKFIVGKFSSTDFSAANAKHEKNTNLPLFQISKGKVSVVREAVVDDNVTVKYMYGTGDVDSLAAAMTSHNADNTKPVMQVTTYPDGREEVVTVLDAVKPDDDDPAAQIQFIVAKKPGTFGPDEDSIAVFDTYPQAEAWRNANNPTASIEERPFTEEDGEISVGNITIREAPQPEDEPKDEGKYEEVFDAKTNKFIPTDEFLSKRPGLKEAYEAGRLRTREVDADGTPLSLPKNPVKDTADAADAARMAAEDMNAVSGKFDPSKPKEMVYLGYPTDNKYGTSEQIDFMLTDYQNNPELYKNVRENHAQAYDQWLGLLTGRVISARRDRDNRDATTGAMRNNSVYEINPTEQFAFAEFPALRNVIGLESKLNEAFKIATSQNKEEMLTTAAAETGAATLAELKTTATNPENGEVSEVVVALAAPYPLSKHPNTMNTLKARGVSDEGIQNLTSFETQPNGLPKVDSNTGLPILSDSHPLLQFVDDLSAIPKGKGSTYFDVFLGMIIPSELPGARNVKGTGQDRQAVANNFLLATGNDAESGISAISSFYQVPNDSISMAVFAAQYGQDNLDKLILERRASSAAALTAASTLTNMEATYFMPDANGLPDYSKPIDFTVATSKVVLAADGFMYVVDKGAQFLKSGTDVVTEFARELTPDQYVNTATAQLSALRNQLVVDPSNTDDPDANRKARENNQRIFDSIAADLASTEVDERGVAKRLLAVRKLYMYLSAYQMAAAIQGGTGGRTISDQDVENMLNAFNFETLTTPEAELASIRGARGMMTRMAAIDGAIAGDDKQRRFAAIKYEQINAAASPQYRTTVYRDILGFANFIQMQKPPSEDEGDVSVFERRGGVSAFSSFVVSQSDDPNMRTPIIDDEEDAKEYDPDLYNQFIGASGT